MNSRSPLFSGLLRPGTITTILASSLLHQVCTLLTYDLMRRLLPSQRIAYIFSNPYPSLSWSDPYRTAGQLYLLDAGHQSIWAYGVWAGRVRQQRYAGLANYYVVERGESVKALLSTVTGLKDSKQAAFLWVWNTPSHLLAFGVQEGAILTGLATLKDYLTDWGDPALIILVEDMHRDLAGFQYLSDHILRLEGKPQECSLRPLKGYGLAAGEIHLNVREERVEYRY